MDQTAALWIKAHHRLGESIIWHQASHCLMWVDLLDPAVFIHDPSRDITRKIGLQLKPPIGSIAATTDPQRLILAHRSGLSLLHIETGALEPYCDPEAGRADIIYNDLKVDHWRRLWVGTSHASESEPRGALWCVKDRNTFALADAGFAISNGPAFSPDGGTMYFNDSAARQTLSYDVSGQGIHAQNRRVFRRYTEAEGLPDGLVTDTEGAIWTAQWGGMSILKLSSDGNLQHKFIVPAFNVTTLCFAGEDMCDIYITTATDGVNAETLQRFPLTGSLFKFKADAPGLPEPLFQL